MFKYRERPKGIRQSLAGSEEGIRLNLAGLVRKDPDKVIRILHKGQVMSERFTGVSCQRLRRQPGQVAGFPGRKALGADSAIS